MAFWVKGFTMSATPDFSRRDGEDAGPRPIGGWLRAALAWIVFLLLWWGYGLVSALSGGALSVFRMGLVADLPPGVFPILRWTFFDLVFQVTISALAMICLALFLRRSRRLPGLLNALNAIVVIALVFDTGMTYAFGDRDTGDATLGLSLAKTWTACLIASAWIAYFQVSRRATETFVR